MISDDSDDDDERIGVEALRPEALAALREVMDGEKEELKEDFGLSQFWYTDECAAELAKKVMTFGRIAVLSCPSLHRALQQLGGDSAVFEIDRRFDDGHFVYFDFRNPDRREDLAKAFDFVVMDPPYVSQDCLREFFRYADFLSPPGRLLVFTSVVNRHFLLEYKDLRLTKYTLSFASKLATPLRAFTNDPTLLDALGGLDVEEL